MKLEKIKLAGFKSFPDPVTVEISSDITAIVGPNGCGKSNIVDAVNWVMGQGPRDVRATTLEDVIFNGTSARRPLGIASVELLFDNSDNSLGGQYASYNQIAVRRSVDRSRESKYFINNTRCRRRDIFDLFAGTGLGSHNYAIIEQGMISRIIEAKPEEIRLYLEEAAGVSKYRERKRDAEVRIRHTNENLERVKDICDEIDKQLQKLKRQARDAEKFKELKSTQHKLSAQLLALQYLQHDQQRGEYAKQMSELRLQLEQNQSELTSVETAVQEQRLLRDEWNERLNQAREHFYAVNADISTAEQEIENRRKSVEQMAEEKRLITEAIEKCLQRLQTQQQRQAQAQQKLQQTERQIEQAGTQLEQQKQQLEVAEQKQAEVSQQWESYHSDTQDLSGGVEVSKVKIDYCLKELESIARHKQAIEQRQASLNVPELSAQLEQDKKKAEALESALADAEKQGGQKARQLAQLRDQLDGTLQKAHQAGIRVQDLSGTLASLKALQADELKHSQESLSGWLQTHQLDKAAKVAEQLHVSSGWEKAVETVLGFFIEGIEVDTLEPYINATKEMEAGSLTMLERRSHAELKQHALAHQVKNDSGVKSLLAHIYTVDGLDEAMRRRSQLAEYESFVTKEGAWIGRHWLRIRKSPDDGGVLSRRKKIEKLDSEVKDAERQVSELHSQAGSLRDQIKDGEAALAHTHQKQQETMQQYADVKLEIQQVEVRAKHGLELSIELDGELDQISHRQSEIKKQHDELQQAYESAVASVSGHDSSRSELEQQRVTSEKEIAELRGQLSEQQQQLHLLEIEKSSLTVELSGLDDGLEQTETQRSELVQRDEAISKVEQSSYEPIEQCQIKVQELIEKRDAHERDIGDCNANLEQNHSTIEELEARSKGFSELKESLQGEREQTHGALQAATARCDDLRHQLAQTDFELEALQADLAENQSIEQTQTELEQAERRIGRLGAINLIAVEEFNELSARKEYLDTQRQDLISALETLQQAIVKIDRESKEKFKNTFDNINNKLADVFTRLFGGGQARLELLESNWLESGVAIMVRPPGKRLTSIRLLSGGEKALAALAVVFAIFELNPAPFCMLDEVDAPLDESNILRFSELIKEMSNRVQFIIITHSRLTMERVDCLVGITMGEPGVSRLVSVNVEEAARMANG